jgi:hypothetical protein
MRRCAEKWIHLGEKVIDDLVLFNRHGVQEDVLERVDLSCLDEATELGDGVPSILVSVTATTRATTTSTSSTASAATVAAITAAREPATKTSTTTTSTTFSSVSHL